MLFFKQVEVNLFDLYLANPNERIIIKLLDQTDEYYLVRINNDEVKLPRRNFKLSRLKSRFNTYKMAVAAAATAISDTTNTTTNTIIDDQTHRPHQTVSVIDSIHHMDAATLLKVESKMATNPTVNLTDYPERWCLDELIFTNHDNTVVVYYTGTVAESDPPQYGFVINSEHTTVSDHASSRDEYCTIDWYIDAYKLHPVEDDIECQRLRQLARTLPQLAEMTDEERSKVVKSSPGWHKRYYPDFNDESPANRKRSKNRKVSNYESDHCTDLYDYDSDEGVDSDSDLE